MTRSDPPPTPGIRFAVGGHIGIWFHAPWPFGVLWANADRIELSMGAFGHTTLRRESVEEVYLARWFIRRGIQFRTNDGSGTWVVAYAPSPERILARLERRGWPVNWSY
jgi:hypothetical protein